MKASIILGLCFLGLSSFAEMDSDARNLLIEKLAKVQRNLAANDSSKVGVTLRLADLLAERARVASMKELDSGCTTCIAGKADREAAIRHYREVLDRVPLASKGKVQIQLGHLYEMTNQDKDAAVFYEKVQIDSSDPTVAAEAALSLAEMSFKKGRFDIARNYYQKVLRVPTASSKGLAAYRSAWCLFNLQKKAEATRELGQMLDTPALLSRNGFQSSEADPQFKEEVSRDYATFMAQTDFSQKDIEHLFNSSPVKTQISNVMTLAVEAERIGHKKESLKVLNFVYDHQSRAQDRIETLARRAPLKLESGDVSGSLQDLGLFVSTWRDLKGCGQADCSEARKLVRQMIVTWNQAEKKTPTENLSIGYQTYLSLFSEDTEMALWGSEVAVALKSSDVAAGRYQMALTNLKNEKSSAAVDEKIEWILLKNIEMAEASKNDALLAKAQDQYLKDSKKGSKKFEVRYQMAKRTYDQGQYKEASVEMKTLALDAKGPMSVRKQAADLALDSLGLLKDDDQIMTWSKDFAKAMPASAAEFSRVTQKAALTKSAAVAATNPEAALAALTQFRPDQAEGSDRIIYLKNKIILAEKTAKFDVAQNAVDELLTIKEISKEDREFALGRQAWLAELRLDFATAFKATEQMTMKDQTPEQKALKLAVYADLAGKNPVPLYNQYLKSTQDAEGKQAVASEIIRRSVDPVKELEVQRPLFEKAPDLYARLYTEVYSKTPSDKILKKATAEVRIQKTTWGRLLSRVALLKDFADQKAPIAKMQIDNKNQRTLGKSIKDRAAKLAQLDVLASKAIQAGDWTSQLVTIDSVAKESDRFYQELMSLPIPEGLNPQEEQEYMQLLNQQASPFKMKAEQAASKVKEFWGSPNWKSDLAKSVDEGSEFRLLIDQELKELKSAAGSSDQEFLTSLIAKNEASATALPNLKEKEAARAELRAHPMSQAALDKLLQLEKKSKNFAMVQYLEGRMRSLAGVSGGTQ